MTTDTTDHGGATDKLIIIGSGPAGYTAASRARNSWPG